MLWLEQSQSRSLPNSSNCIGFHSWFKMVLFWQVCNIWGARELSSLSSVLKSVGQQTKNMTMRKGLERRIISSCLLWIKSHMGPTKKVAHAITRPSTCLGAVHWSEVEQGGMTSRTLPQIEHGWGLAAWQKQLVPRGNSRKTNIRPEEKKSLSRKTIQLNSRESCYWFRWTHAPKRSC